MSHHPIDLEYEGVKHLSFAGQGRPYEALLMPNAARTMDTDKSEAGAEFVRVGTLEEVAARRMTVVSGAHPPILVISDGARCFAVDNRCPHLGFPLHRGTVEDGILTCHWHHARFDVASGGGFDLWADDLPTAAVEVRDGDVWVCPKLRHADGKEHGRRRLRDGMEHDLGLVIAKAILGLRAQGVAAIDLVREAALFGARARADWGAGLTVLTALANLHGVLPQELGDLALYKGITRVSRDCAAQPARRAGRALDPAPPTDTLARWLRHWTAVRHRDGIERTLLAAIAGGATPPVLAEMLLVAATDRAFADGGHLLDFVNKAFELLDLIGWTHAETVLPTLVEPLANARGAEESNAWRHPVDLIKLAEDAAAELPSAIAAGAGRGRRWDATSGLAQTFLGDSVPAMAQAVIHATAEGAAPGELGRALAYAAALRVARFGTANEHSDRDAAHHAFTYANAVHRMLARIGNGGRAPSAQCLRAVLHGAVRVYLLRFLNVPPAQLPGEDGDRLDDLPSDAAALGQGFLDALDRHGSTELAARHVARHFALSHDFGALVATLAQAVLREDAGFHSYQMLEAGVAQFREWGPTREGRHILIAAARYLAAHSPTERSDLQTAVVAHKLARGEKLY
ncbi:Rieske (2Fe-2S) protein [Azohydromonas lata]|uniref:Rieske 2Fe-2S domain-containing protein n=1 Tax=Azohydromonas lata TaxID=45677 RepID=A0ABU5I810_9BURK|nr:Rieske 2Fe-2S domain-containing protein [Azohydromonas lata]MDZ5454974.1 Rieske 2Fe-2S domain-containing protein [Azohydromonas lata]